MVNGPKWIRRRARRPAPLIVFGAPRSGTTYVREILDADDRVCITQETRVFTWAHRTLGLTADERAMREAFAGQIDPMIEDGVRSTIERIYRELCPNAIVWGDKNPLYAAASDPGCLATIDRLFPGTMFIHVIRDGRDVVASLVRKQHRDGSPWARLEDAVGSWVAHVQNGRHFGDQMPPDRYLELRYEDLVNDGVGTTETAFRFVGLQMAATVLDFVRDQATEPTPFAGPTRDLSLGAGTSEWELVFADAEERRELDRLTPLLADLGYVK